MANEPSAQYNIGPVCSIDAAVGTQTHSAAPNSEQPQGQSTHSFHELWNRDGSDVPSPFGALIPRWPRDVLFLNQ